MVAASSPSRFPFSVSDEQATLIESCHDRTVYRLLVQNAMESFYVDFLDAEMGARTRAMTESNDY